MLILGGLVLVSLGVIAEYLGMAASMSMGKPLFVATSEPRRVADTTDAVVAPPARR